MRFGLKDKKKSTLAEIGIELGVSSNRIRQIELKALRKLRQSSKIGLLKSCGDVNFIKAVCG
jgi:RNA polymerase primary sigma factor